MAADLRFSTRGTPGRRDPAAVPAWFTDAVATAYDVGSVRSAGAEVTYRAWGTPGDPVLLLVHGGGAHAGWWDHLAPLLVGGAGGAGGRHRVVAPDLSGHGASEHRASYSLAGWAEELRAVLRAETSAAAASGGAAPVVVGHSMGGCVALTAAHAFGAQLRAVVVVDSSVRPTPPDVAAWIRAREPLPAHRVRTDRAAAVARFQALPADPALLGYVSDHVAAQSVREVPGGWSWSFDPDVYYHARMEPTEIRPAHCDVALVSGERGLADAAVVAAVRDRLGRPAPHVEVPDCGHHLLLEQPLALVGVLRTLLAGWADAAVSRRAAG